MIDNYDPKASLRHWPAPMARFGKNPYGENLYRIVFAPSRRMIAYGTWADGSRKARYIPKYPEIGDQWILERWMTPYEYTGRTPEQWKQTLTVLGPYPDRGEYEVSHVFEACGPTDANLTKLISWIEEGRKRSWWENRTACQADSEADEKERKNLREAIIRDSLPAFGTAPLSGYGGGRGTKTAPILKSAEELGLPTTNTMVNRPLANPQTFEIRP